MGRTTLDGRAGAAAPALADAGAGRHSVLVPSRIDVPALRRDVTAVIAAWGLPSPACAGRSPPVIRTSTRSPGRS